MNKRELEKYGKQFDHFHFEVLRVPPIKINPTDKTPDRHFTSYTLSGTTREKLHRYFYDPTVFLKERL
jgi:hypothetical protein